MEEKKAMFRDLYEKFLIGCDAMEYQDSWDKEQYGEMETYYENELLSVILCLIVADGKIDVKEVEIVNELFGSDYTVTELKDVYFQCADGVQEIFETGIEESYLMLKKANAKAAEAYGKILGLIADMAAESDGKVFQVEVDQINRLKQIACL